MHEVLLSTFAKCFSKEAQCRGFLAGVTFGCKFDYRASLVRCYTVQRKNTSAHAHAHTKPRHSNKHILCRTHGSGIESRSIMKDNLAEQYAL